MIKTNKISVFICISVLCGLSLFCSSLGTSEVVSFPPDIKALSCHNAILIVDGILSTKMPDLDSDRRYQLAKVIVSESLAAGYDPLFSLAVIESESRFDMEAVSPTGARGLMQVVPSTWDEEVKKSNLGHLEKFNPAHNATVGIKYLGRLGRNFKRIESVLLAYNQGPSTATSIIAGITTPTLEASAYGPLVISKYKEILSSLGFNPKKYVAFWRSPNLTLLVVPGGFEGEGKMILPGEVGSYQTVSTLRVVRVHSGNLVVEDHNHASISSFAQCRLGSQLFLIPRRHRYHRGRLGDILPSARRCFSRPRQESNWAPLYACSRIHINDCPKVYRYKSDDHRYRYTAFCAGP